MRQQSVSKRSSLLERILRLSMMHVYTERYLCFSSVTHYVVS